MDLAGQWICLAAPELGDGPLTVTCALPDGLAVGAPARADAGVLRIGRYFSLATVSARIWRPPEPLGWTRESLSRGLDAAAVAMGAPRDGLGIFSDCPFSDCPSSDCPSVAARLRAWLGGAMGGGDPAPPDIGALVGLGPGLTPSGDDVLGGAMVAAHALRRPDIARRIYAVVTDSATGPVSRAHLAAASEGAAAAPLHLLLNDILCGRTAALPARFAAIGRIGHSSGWDAFAGADMALRAWLAPLIFVGDERDERRVELGPAAEKIQLDDAGGEAHVAADLAH